MRSFNPRPREGGDLALQFRDQLYEVSIRAPVKGAIEYPRQRRLGPECFNPRPREGGDTAS